jgi:polyketide synthase PksN
MRSDWTLSVIRGDAPLADYGVDSIIGVNFVRTLNEALQIELEPTKLFEYSTVDQLTQYIATLSPALPSAPVQISAAKRGWGQPQPHSTIPVEAEVMPQRRFLGDEWLAGAGVPAIDQDRGVQNIGIEPIAIIGMSGRCGIGVAGRVLAASRRRRRSGEAGFALERHRLRGAGIESSGVLQQRRCDRLHRSLRCGVLRDLAAGSNVHGFAAAPVSRGIVEGPGGRELRGKGARETVRRLRRLRNIELYGSLRGRCAAAGVVGNSQSIVPARIAYHLNLQGPAIAVDSACSSALVAIHLACQGLWAGETEMALAGGVYVQATSGFHQVANRAGMLSPDEKCYSFDGRANRFAPGKAVGVVVLKHQRDALRDGDHIHGVIVGSGINQDGKSNGLTAPNGRAQERLERGSTTGSQSIRRRSGSSKPTARERCFGDSIEHGAITRSFRESTDKKDCAMGSVKTNIGHAGNAAGIASVLKVLLSLKHRQIPPSLHFEKASPAIDFGSSPFYINTQLAEWPAEDGRKRRAAVSSFGFSGTNAHLVIEEAPAVERRAVQSPAYLVVLSARNADQLRQHAHNLLALAKSTPDLSMNDLSYSLFVGRMHLSHRLSCVARSQPELIQWLERWLDTGAAGQVHTAELSEGRVREQAALKKFGNFCIRECKETTDAGVMWRTSLRSPITTCRDIRSIIRPCSRASRAACRYRRIRLRRSVIGSRAHMGRDGRP